MGKTFNMVGGGGAGSPDLPIGSRINVTSDIGATIDITKGSLHYQKTISVALPNEYQRVDYIQSSGTQYINTGLLPPTNGYKAIGKLRYVGTQNNYASVMGSFKTLETANKFGRNYNTSYWTATFGNNLISSATFSTDTDYGFEISYLKGNKYLKINGETIISSSDESSLYNGYPIFLFVYNRDGSALTSESFKGRIYYCELYDDNGTLVRNMLPCYRISDSVIGMYDTVNDVFYENAGSGTFTKGADITQGTVTFTVNYSGTWQLSASKSGEETLTDTVSVLADDTDYNKTMLWRNYLYNIGNEITSLTGGWTSSGYSRTDGSNIYQATKNTSNINYTGTTNGVTLCGTANAINVTDFSKLVFEVDISYVSSGASIGFYIVSSKSNYNSYVVGSVNTGVLGVQEVYIDLSAKSGNIYVMAQVGRDSHNFGNINRVWLE